MSTAKLAQNVDAYDPDTDPAKIDLEALRARGWPSPVLDCIRALQHLRSRNLSGPYVQYNPASEAPQKPRSE